MRQVGKEKSLLVKQACDFKFCVEMAMPQLGAA